MDDLAEIVENTQELTVKEPGNQVSTESRLPGKRFGSDFSPKNLDELIKLSTIMARSGIVPAAMKDKPEDVFVAIGMGIECGLSPFQAVQAVAVVNGRPTIWGDHAKALIDNEANLVSFEEWGQDEAFKNESGWCKIVKKIGDTLAVTERRFTVEEAKKAGLWSKAGVWQNYPGRMLQMRARAFAMRDAFPGALKGLSLREEVEDYAKPGIRPPSEVIRKPVELTPVERTAIEQGIVAQPENTPLESKGITEMDFTSFITQKQAKIINSLKNAHKVTKEQFDSYLLTELGIDSYTKIKAADYNKVCDWIEKGEK